MPKKSEIWKSYKELKNELDEQRIPAQFNAIKWRTKKADMAQALTQLQEYRDQQAEQERKARQQEYKNFTIERIDADNLNIIDINSDPPVEATVREIKDVLTQILPNRTVVLLTTAVFEDASSGDLRRISRTFSNSSALQEALIKWLEGYDNDDEELIRIEIEIQYIDVIPQPPPMAFSTQSINCVLDQCFKQSHKPSILKEPGKLFMSLEDIEHLEKKHKLNIYITDSFNKLWRKPEVIHPKRSSRFPVDVFIKCHNFHATKALRITEFTLPDTKKESKNYELISNFYIPSAPKKISYLTARELMNLHIDLLKQGIIHHIIDTGTKVIGIIHNDHYYKGDIQKYPFTNSSDWSLSGYARRIFKQSIKNPVLQLQISDPIVYRNIQKSQTPITVLFKQKASGNIYQIDQTQAYKNASVGNLDETPKRFYRGYPSAPRNIISVNEELSKPLLKRLLSLGLGFALIEFDQTELIKSGAIPLLHTGKPHPKGETVLSLPALEYYALFPLKVKVKQYYYSKYRHYPFNKPIKQFDALLEKTDKESPYYRDIRNLSNLLIGGLNKRHHRCKVFSTSSLAECQRFLKDETKTIHRFKTIQRFEERIRLLDDVDESNITLHDEYIFYYQEKDEEIMESFNQTHLSKYVLDYQKIALHHKAQEVCNNRIENLLCINTDSITYNTTINTTNSLWHLEAQGNQFYGHSNGLRAIAQDEEMIYSRHSGHKKPLTIAQYKAISDKYNLKVYHQTKTYSLTEEYDTALEDTPLPNQKLHTLFRPAGYGKTELSKYLSGKESKFQVPLGLPPLKIYPRESILLVGTTHVARKLLNGKYTMAGLITRLSRGVIKDLKMIKAILIDEISMSSDSQLKKLDTVLRRTKRINRPFGGIDIYLVGHMKQLPNPDENSVPITNNPLVKTIFTSINNYLPVNHRQSSDPLFQSILSKIENYYNIGGDEKSNQKAKRILSKILNPEELKALKSRIKPPTQKPTRSNYYATPLHYTNRMVEQDNKAIGKIQAGEEVIIRFNRNKFFNGDRHKIQEVRTAELKKSIKINNSWLDYDKYFIRQTDKHGKTESYPRIQLAHSMTIHCSQGQTIPSVYLYAKSLTMNMLYVAMSRVRNLNSLYLANLL